MNLKQKRFAEEYSIDHNATAAAIRAGYAEGTARQQGSRLLAKPDVAQLVQKLDAEKRDELGLEAQAVIEELQELYRQARERQPRIWKGEPVTYLDPETNEIRMVLEFMSAAVTSKAIELMMKKTGLESKTPVEHTGEVVYTLHLDRDLSQAPHDESDES
jgi:phage terminase small subunit